MLNKIKELLKTPAQREAEAQAIQQEEAEEAQKRLAAEEKRKAAKARREAKKAELAAKKNTKTPKELATAAGEPWVNVLAIEVDSADPGQGAFELDWNDIFVARLIKAGYQGKTDQDIVDNWFKTVCRNVLVETYEQMQADPEQRNKPVQKRDLGDGRSEFS
jgi:DNA-binding transcriptional MerR regulator